MWTAFKLLPLALRLVMVSSIVAAGAASIGWWSSNRTANSLRVERDAALERSGMLQGAIERQNEAIAQLAQVAEVRRQAAQAARAAAQEAGRLSDAEIARILNTPRPIDPSPGAVCSAADSLILEFSR